jgi:hypothetical protein
MAFGYGTALRQRKAGQPVDPSIPLPNTASGAMPYRIGIDDQDRGDPSMPVRTGDQQPDPKAAAMDAVAGRPNRPNAASAPSGAATPAVRLPDAGGGEKVPMRLRHPGLFAFMASLAYGDEAPSFLKGVRDEDFRKKQLDLEARKVGVSERLAGSRIGASANWPPPKEQWPAGRIPGTKKDQWFAEPGRKMTVDKWGRRVNVQGGRATPIQEQTQPGQPDVPLEVPPPQPHQPAPQRPVPHFKTDERGNETVTWVYPPGSQGSGAPQGSAPPLQPSQGGPAGQPGMVHQDLGFKVAPSASMQGLHQQLQESTRLLDELGKNFAKRPQSEWMKGAQTAGANMFGRGLGADLGLAGIPGHIGAEGQNAQIHENDRKALAVTLTFPLTLSRRGGEGAQQKLLDIIPHWTSPPAVWATFDRQMRDLIRIADTAPWGTPGSQDYEQAAGEYEARLNRAAAAVQAAQEQYGGGAPAAPAPTGAARHLSGGKPRRDPRDLANEALGPR